MLTNNTIHTDPNTIHTDPKIRISGLRIHVAPVGYEIDRILISAIKMKADKVMLLVDENRALDKAGPFHEKISKQLEEKAIEVETIYHDRKDMFKIIKAVKSIIESEDGNKIFINLASGSKMQAIGCMMAAMMFNDNDNVRPFYAEAEKYGAFTSKPISTGVKSINELPIYEIQKPNDKLVKSLAIIMENNGKISKTEMAKIAKEREILSIKAENESQATFASLEANIIGPLADKWQFIKVTKVGRTRWIELTEEGKRAAEFLV